MFHTRLVQRILKYCDGHKLSVTTLIIHQKFDLLDILLGKKEIELNKNDDEEIICIIIYGVESENNADGAYIVNPNVYYYLANNNLVNIGKMMEYNFCMFQSLSEIGYIFDNLINIKYAYECGLELNYIIDDRTDADLLDTAVKMCNLDVFKFILDKLNTLNKYKRNIGKCTVINSLQNNNDDVFIYVLSKCDINTHIEGVNDIKLFANKNKQRYDIICKYFDT
jgi:hypothetical protein